MNRLLQRCFLAAIAALVTALPTWAQQANVNLDWNPQKNTQNLAPFGANIISPEVRDDGMVTFRVRGPKVQEVTLSAGTIAAGLGMGNKPFPPFTKGEDGIWTLTIGPVPPNIYVYKIVIDGVAVVDPANTLTGFADQPGYSQLVVHGTGPAYYDARPVPHGTVTRHVYRSEVTNGEREMYVPIFDGTVELRPRVASPDQVAGRAQGRDQRQQWHRRRLHGPVLHAREQQQRAEHRDAEVHHEDLGRHRQRGGGAEDHVVHRVGEARGRGQQVDPAGRTLEDARAAEDEPRAGDRVMRVIGAGCSEQDVDVRCHRPPRRTTNDSTADRCRWRARPGRGIRPVATHPCGRACRDATVAAVLPR